MKKFLLLGMLAISQTFQGQISVYECNSENSTMSQLELIGPEPEINKPCAWFDNQAPYLFLGNHQKTVQATNEIHIKTNFHAKPVGNGELHLQVGNKGNFEVVCMNYPDMLNVLRYEKFELGITLPQSVQERVDNFINSAPVSDDQSINPFMDWDIRIAVDFTHPQIPYDLSVDAFYNKEYQAWMNEIPETVPAGQILENYPSNNYAGFYNSLGGYTEQPTEYPFLARFAPPRNGKWKCIVRMYVKGGETYIADPFYFTVIESGSKGYVQVSNDQRTFTLGGEPFYPLGANILWPMTDSIVNNPGVVNENLFKLLTDQPNANSNGVHFATEEYRGLFPLPILYDNYRNLIKNIADKSGNFVRLIMHPFSTDIEFERVGDYSKRLYIAQELDEVLEYCESRDVYIDWNMLVHFVLQDNHYSIGWNNNYNGKVFDYKSLPNMTDPQNFFSSPEAKAYFKQKIRYVLARWGYSTNIAMFELFSEISGNPGYLQNKEKYRLWQEEMAGYIKDRYNGVIHMLQPGYTFKLSPDDYDNAFQNVNFNNFGVNIYPGSKTFSGKWIDHINKDILDQTEECPVNKLFVDCTVSGPWWNRVNSRVTFTMPVFLPEFDPGGDVEFWGNKEICDPTSLEIKRAMWQMPFTGVAGGVSWNAYRNGIVFNEMPRIKTFLEHMEGKGGWHPGAMERLDNGRWVYRSDWANDMDGFEKRADLSYLRSNDRNYAIGVITNKTVNIYSMSECADDYFLFKRDNPGNFEFNFERLASPGEIHTEDNDQQLKLNGMRNGRYYFNFYFPNDLYTAIHINDKPSNNGKVEIEVSMEGLESEYLVLFLARRQGNFWISPIEDSIRELAASKNLVSKIIEVDIHDELGNISETSELKAYPVPTNNKIIIQSGNMEGELSVNVVSSEGKVLDMLNITDKETELDISTYSNGIYILKFYVNGVEISQKKIVKI